MDFWEVFTLVTGIVYIVLEIRQSNWMWIVGILTGAAAVVVFARGSLYASMGLNVYYVLISFWGLYAWRRDARKLSEEAPSSSVHLVRLDLKVVIVSALLMFALTAALLFVLRALGDPGSTLDAAVTVLSAIATWWLSRSHIEQWWLWIAADGLSAALCATQGLWWMVALYVLYCLSAVYGYFYWRRNGSLIYEETVDTVVVADGGCAAGGTGEASDSIH